MRQKLTDLSVRKLEKPQTQTRPVEPGNYTFLNATKAPEKCYLQFLMNTLLTLNIFSHLLPKFPSKIWFFRGRKSGNQGNSQCWQPRVSEPICCSTGSSQGFVTGIHATPGKLTGMTGSGYPNKGRHLTKATGSK